VVNSLGTLAGSLAGYHLLRDAAREHCTVATPSHVCYNHKLQNGGIQAKAAMQCNCYFRMSVDVGLSEMDFFAPCAQHVAIGLYVLRVVILV